MNIDLTADIEDFLKKGGQITQVPITARVGTKVHTNPKRREKMRKAQIKYRPAARND